MGAELSACKQPCHCSCADRTIESITGGSAPASYVVKVQELNLQPAEKASGSKESTASTACDTDEPPVAELEQQQKDLEEVEQRQQAEESRQEEEPYNVGSGPAPNSTQPPRMPEEDAHHAAVSITDQTGHLKLSHELSADCSAAETAAELASSVGGSEHHSNRMLSKDKPSSSRSRSKEGAGSGISGEDRNGVAKPVQRSSQQQSAPSAMHGPPKRTSKQLLAETADVACQGASENPAIGMRGIAQQGIGEKLDQAKRPKGGLVLGFQLPDGSFREASFFGRKPPLGINFTKMGQLTCKSVEPGGHGDQLGVAAGWMVHYVNGEDVRGMEIADILQRIKIAMSC